MKNFKTIFLLFFLVAGFVSLFSFHLPGRAQGTSISGFLDSSTIDTGVVAGAQLNAVLWQGYRAPGTSVGFQFATSGSSGGPWNFVGPDGTDSSYFLPSPNFPLSLPYTFSGIRYFRYRITLFSDPADKYTPSVGFVVVNWSP